MTERIAIFGGTFDPIHNGHLRVFEQVTARPEYDAGWILVANTPNLRPTPKTAADIRLEMAEAAARDRGWSVCDLEIKREGLTYTVDTMRELYALRPDAIFDFVLGADSARQIRQWHEWRELLDRNSFVILNRAGMDPVGEDEAFELGFPRDATTLLSVDSPDISATTIRNLVSEGGDISELVPESVAQVIAEHGLYRETAATAWHNGRE